MNEVGGKQEILSVWFFQPRRCDPSPVLMLLCVVRVLSRVALIRERSRQLGDIGVPGFYTM